VSFKFYNSEIENPRALVHAPFTISNASGALVLDMANGAFQKIEIDAAATSITIDAAIGGLIAGASYRFAIIQSATGSATVDFGAGFMWRGGVAPTVSTAADALDIVTGECVDVGGSLYILGELFDDYQAPPVPPSGLVNDKSAALSGSGSYIDLGNSSAGSLHDALDIAAKEVSGDGMSVGCWFRRTANSSHEILAAKMDNSSRGILLFLDAGGEVHLQIYNSGFRLQIKSTKTFDDGIWHFALFTFKPATNARDLYVDGVSNNSISTAGPASTPTAPSIVQLGAYGTTAASTGTYNFTGDLDEISFWDDALSAADAARLFNFSVPTDLNADAAAPVLVSWYRLGDAAGDTASQFKDASTASAYTRNDSAAVSGATINSAGASGLAHEWHLDDDAMMPADTGFAGSMMMSGGNPALVAAGTGTKDSLYFDGVGSPHDVISTSGGSSFVSASITLAFWVKLITTGSWDMIFNIHPGGGWGAGGLSCYLYAGAIRFGIKSYATVASATAPTIGVWTHVACVVDVSAGLGQIYLDGVAGTALGSVLDPTLDGSSSSAWLASSQFGIGAIPSYNYGSDAEVSNFQIYDRALAPSQIVALVAKGLGAW